MKTMIKRMATFVKRSCLAPARRTVRRIANTPFAKDLRRRSKKLARKISHHAYHKPKRAAKRVHHHVAVRPHLFLMARLNWYKRYHEWRWHPHVHVSIVGIYVAVLTGVVLVNFGKTYASDLATVWDFSNPTHYAVDAGLEVSDEQGRMRAQNYESDGNTMGLYHLDETSGTTVADSSPNNNVGESHATTPVTGLLNGGYSLNGVDSYIRVQDSPSLSFGQANTLEGWIKPSQPITAGSSYQPSTIIDKGDYSLRIDNETGKLTYELANNSAQNWNRAAGNDIKNSWDTDGKTAVSASTTLQGKLYVGTGVGLGDAEVWMKDGDTWKMIGGDGVNDSWADQTFETVRALASDGTHIYAGLGDTAGDAEVWRWDGSSWTKIGGDTVNSSWQLNTFEAVQELYYMNGTLYAGLGNSANDAEVWSWDGNTWTKVGGDSINSGWTTNYEQVASLTGDGTNLYAGLGSTAGDAEVWRWNGSSWTKIGGDGVNGSWDTDYETVRSLAWHGSTLYAGLGDSADDAEVWRWNGSSWTKIGGDSVNSGWGAGYEYVMALYYSGTNLYAGLGASNGDGDVYRWNGSSWTKIGGDGVNGSWPTASGDTVFDLIELGGKIYASLYDSAGGGYVYSFDGSSWTLEGGQYVNESWGYYGQGSVEKLYAARGKLYAGLGNAAGSAQVWEYDGGTDRWTIIGGQGIRGSWAANTYEVISAMSSFNGNLVIGLGTTANDAEVWSYDGSSWAKIGGDSVNSGWTTNYEEVDSLASYGDYLYAGLGASANDAEVWRWNGSSWTKIGGDSINSGWTTNYERVMSMTIYSGQLHVGLGTTANDAEVWRWNGSAWAKVGGDGVNGSWSDNIEQVESMISYDGKLYVGTGTSAGDADVWSWDGTSWQQIGGDEMNSSWAAGTYELARSLTVYNGDLYAGLGNSTGDGELWRYSNGAWEKVGGNLVNNSWGNAAEEVESLSVYQGKLYAGTGNSANADAAVWSLGNNGYLESNQDSFGTDWAHVAATYDGTTMKLYINGQLDSTKDVSLSIPDSNKDLLIGSSYGSSEQARPQGYFSGLLDEVRISDAARNTFTTKPYATSLQTITLSQAGLTGGVKNYTTFSSNETPSGGAITYRLSNDNGATWQYWDGGTWKKSTEPVQSNSSQVINDNIADFPVTFYGLKWQAVFSSNGNQRVALNSITVGSVSDTTAPSSNASDIKMYKSHGGSQVSNNAWTNGSSPSFTWTPGEDADSGIKGYCAYLGSDNTANPVTTAGVLGVSPAPTGNHCQFIVTGAELNLAEPGYLGTPLVASNDPYYLRVIAIDNAGNLAGSVAQFQFRFDNTAPTNPSYLTAPSGFISTKQTTLTWPTSGPLAPSDSGSGIAGLQYRINSSPWYGDNHTGSGDMNDLLANDGDYTTVETPDFSNIQDGINTIYFRTWDHAGNVTTNYVTAIVKINTSNAPSEPLNLTASPSYNTTNSFAFDWDEPASFVGEANKITYCYSINTLPNQSNCSYTSPGVTSLGGGAYATQPGANTFYVVARDESGNMNYASYASTTFTANTAAPGIPTNIDIVDVSIKTTSQWRLALTWDEPDGSPGAVSSYRVYRSTNATTYSFVGSSSSTTYIDANLTQQKYYYQVRACDNTNNCSADSTTVNLTPTGRFTSPAVLTSDPKATNITTKKAMISWTTDRGSDSKIALGTSSGAYAASEVGNSNQVAAHSLELDNLAAGTTYYYVARWTDEDGNTGSSQEFTFTTAPAPVIKNIEALDTGLTSTTIQFTSVGATKVALYFGQNDAFGGLKTVNTSRSESQYTITLDGLQDGTRYAYRLSAFDEEGTEYLGNIFSFTTPPRPRITSLRFQPIEGEPTSTQLVTWETNVPSTSSVTYGKVGGNGVDLQDSELKTSHQIRINNLEDDSVYFLVAQSRDQGGNLAVSERQQFRTALDTRPPNVSDISIESSIRGTGAEARGQVIVSWTTDEPSTSQVGYSEGSGATVFNNKTAEDTELKTQHLVIVSDLPTSRVYSIQPLAKDKAGNVGKGDVQSAIIGRANENVLTVIINSLQKVFGF